MVFARVFGFLGLLINLCLAEFDPNTIPHTSKADIMKMIESGDNEVLVFVYTNFDECPACKTKMPVFHESVELLDRLEEGKVKSFKLAVKFPEYGLTTFPSLALFLGEHSFRYDRPEEFSPEAIVDWIEEAKQTPLPELTDETFEHLTQASTGSTTGDWLVMFANKQRPACLKPNLPDLGTTAVRLRRRKNVAVVDTSKSQIVAKRFDMEKDTHCVKYLYFHRTDLYHYNSDNRTTAALLNFVLTDYVNHKPLTVPPPMDHKNAKLEDAIAALTAMFSEHAQLSQLSFVAGVGFGLLAVLCAILFILRKFRKRKIN